MKIVIVGAGTVGAELVQQLSKEGHDLVVVDKDESLVERIVNLYDIMGVFGNGASYEVLQEADIENCDLLIAATQQDELNILCCLLGKKFGAKDSIARVRNPEYFSVFKGKELGLSLMVNPEYEVAKEISRILKFPAAIKIEPFADGKVDLVEIKVPEDSVLNNLNLREISSKLVNKVLVCAVQRDGYVYIPQGDFRLLCGDRIYVTASQTVISGFFKELGISKGVRRVLLIGGSRVSYYLAKELRAVGVAVKIIEGDRARCEQLDETLDKVDIICGEGTDQKLLIDEGLLDTDAVVALGDIDEQNIIISMFAGSKKAKKVITKVEKGSYFAMLEGIGVDSVVSAKTSTANQIVRYVRSKSSAEGGAVSKVLRIVGDQAEAVEYLVGSDFSALNIPLKSLKLKKNLLIAAIIRGNEVITPSGNDSILAGDSIIVLTAHHTVEDLNDILA